jgi:hypothetical protein
MARPLQLALLVSFGIWFAGCSKPVSDVELASAQHDEQGRKFVEVLEDADTAKVQRAQATGFDAAHCREIGLKPLEEAATLSPEKAALWDARIEGLNGDQVARVAFGFAEDNDMTTEDFDRTLLYLLSRSAEKGSALGLNEIGASQLYCYQGVGQDLPSAARWLELAVAGHDSQAMLSLGRMHVHGLLGEQSSYDFGISLLRRCAFVGNDECDTEYKALYEVHKAAP